MTRRSSTELDCIQRKERAARGSHSWQQRLESQRQIEQQKQQEQRTLLVALNM